MQQQLSGGLQQRDDARDNEQRDKDGAHRVRHHPAVVLDHRRGNDDPHAAQSVRQHMQEDPPHVVVLVPMVAVAVARRLQPDMVV